MTDQDQPGGAPTVEGRPTARGDSQAIELSKPRRATARRFAEARAVVPQLELSEAVELSALRARGASLTASIIALAGATLADHPRLNASWRDGGIEEYSRRNLAVAAASPTGVAHPTIFDADQKDAGEVERELDELTRTAAEGELRAPQTAGATFNLQPPAGAREIAATVSSGTAGALTIGEPHAAVVSRRGEPMVGEICVLSLSCDGRVVLPEQAGAFISALRSRIEGREGE